VILVGARGPSGGSNLDGECGTNSMQCLCRRCASMFGFGLRHLAPQGYRRFDIHGLLVGQVIEIVTGESLGEVLEACIVSRLGLADTPALPLGLSLERRCIQSLGLLLGQSRHPPVVQRRSHLYHCTRSLIPRGQSSPL
jgi:hypothetical protein